MIVPALLFATAVNAQNGTLKIECMTEEKMVALLDEYGEVSTIGGASLRLNDEGNAGREGLIIFANPKTLTWTIVEKFKDVYCVVAAGTDLKILPKGKSSDI
jgi:hypothetical protein